MLKYILSFIALIVAQVLVFNQIQFSGFINPAFYILFILILPLNTAAWLRLLSAFILGFTIDIFSQSPGLHTASTVLIAYLQPLITGTFKTSDIDENKSSSMSHLGIQWFLSSSAILILIHQASYFILEVFRLSNFSDTIYRIVLSSFATFTTITIAQFMIYKKQQ